MGNLTIHVNNSSKSKGTWSINPSKNSKEYVKKSLYDDTQKSLFLYTELYGNVSKQRDTYFRCLVASIMVILISIIIILMV